MAGRFSLPAGIPSLQFVHTVVRWLPSANPARIDPLSAVTYYAYSAFNYSIVKVQRNTGRDRAEGC